MSIYSFHLNICAKLRWIIERTSSCLQTFRRLVVRYERSVTIFMALVHLACA
jgi:transposase